MRSAAATLALAALAAATLGGAEPRPSGIGRVAWLVAWIEGTAGGKARRVEFPYRRTACPGR